MQAEPRFVRDLIAPERDTTPARGAVPPSEAYLVLSTPRSGSGLLCRGLASTGVAAVPMEYFNPVLRSMLVRRWGCGETLHEYRDALWSHRTSADGRFGTKMHWDQLGPLRSEALAGRAGEPEYDLSAAFLGAIFPAARYLRILRRDVNRQAVSFWTALNTETWSVASGSAEGEPEVRYSFEGIERCRRLIENAEVHWDRFLRFNGMRLLEIVYEDLVADYPGSIGAAVRHVAPSATLGAVPAPSIRRMGGRRAEELLERFTRELADRGFPDPLTAPMSP